MELSSESTFVNSESSCDESGSRNSVEAKSARKRNHFNSSSRRSNTESNSSVPSSPNSKHSRTDDAVIDQIEKIVNNPEIMEGPEVYNDFNCIMLAKRRESQKQVALHIISNSLNQTVSDEVLTWLVSLKNIIFHELTRIPRSYITRLVFDSKHRNLVLVKDNKVIGGICFRMFPTKDFSEIVFLVVSSSCHLQGYGTYMLNHVKDYHIKHNIHNLLTYAATEAFGFFEKQGFSDKITLPESVFQGYINVYQEATLMECQLDRRITYTELPDVISRQKLIVRKLIENYQKPNKETSDETSNSEANGTKSNKLCSLDGASPAV